VLRGVADVNVLVSAFISRLPVQTSRRLIDAAFEGKWLLVVSPHLLAELDEVLHREKFRRWASVEEAESFIEEVRIRSLSVLDATEPWPAVTRDPKDDYLVALAQTAGVDALISGDSHLTELTDLVPPVVRPADFLAMVQ
jgi:putative PIN family toxin of toxin-antitoxin system